VKTAHHEVKPKLPATVGCRRPGDSFIVESEGCTHSYLVRSHKDVRPQRESKSLIGPFCDYCARLYCTA